MNLPNKLTLLRIILIPFCIAAMLIEAIPHRFAVALVIFIAAFITDALDGNIARKRNLVTDFGKMMDPLADKMLAISVLICFVELNVVSGLVVVIVIMRELMVTSLRMIAVEKGKVIAADIFGKIKTMFQAIALSVTFALCEAWELTILPENFPAQLIIDIMMWIMAALTLISGANYLIKNRSIISK